ncbi:hypothetical protein LCGC14_0868090 [marine sediment metagenome]|uniref:Radical SAM core domain-containing protein n=1 Tax=marine sediment metagenome TaxID=412755 RepID=A0A0F9RQ27_9ZZZZ
MYKENPKTKGSGIVCAIPQTGICPNMCDDCFFQSGRSYLEPLNENLPNMPDRWSVRTKNNVVRINDGNDSNCTTANIGWATRDYSMKFYNTAIPKLDHFDAPVVLTVNPGDMTDNDFHKLNTIPENLMFVRFRANTWNQSLGGQVVEHYATAQIPVVFTFMAYFTQIIPEAHDSFYTYRKRTLNSYWVIIQEAWDTVMAPYKHDEYVYACGKNANSFPCHRCGNCLREYFATTERINP